MNLRDALSFAIDFMRSHSTAEGDAGKAATALERKLSQIRAKEQRGKDIVPPRCLCGQVKARKPLVCGDCYSVIPMALLIRAAIGKRKERARAMANIRVICETREAVEAANAA